MELSKLYTELKRRKITLEMAGSQLVAIDPFERLSPALDAGIRLHRDILAAALKAVSAAYRPLQEAIEEALVGTDLDQVIDDTDVAYQRGDLTQEEAEQLARRATARSRQIPACIEEMSLARFATSGRVREVKSKVLGETVLWAADNAEIPADNDRVVYRAHELKELVGIAPEQLRRIHTVKQVFDGDAIAPTKDEAIVWIGDVIEPAPYGPGGTCWVCRQQQWWQKKSGQWICGICHPDPKKQAAQGGPE